MEMKKRFKILLSSAKARGIPVNLNTKYYSDLISMGCLYCGDSLTDKSGSCLDRQDNKKGYTNENVVGCCKICNYAKRTLSDSEFYHWVQRVYNHQRKCMELVSEYSYANNYKANSVNKKELNIYFNKSIVKNAEVLVYKPCEE